MIMTMYMAWTKKGGKRAICKIPVLTAEEKAELKARIAEALQLSGISTTALA